MQHKRRGHDGLTAIVLNQWALDPFSGHVFAFVGRRLDRVKFVFWQRNGFVLVYKRLEKGRFRLPKVESGQERVEIDPTQLVLLLDGVDWSRVKRPNAREPRSIE